MKNHIPAAGTVRGLQPALASVKDACAYLGGLSRSKFYADLLPRLDTVKIDGRSFVTVVSLDRLIDEMRAK